MSALLISAGMLLIVIGFFLVILGSVGSMFGRDGGDEKPKTEVKGGGVIMIGPIPVVFGSDRKSVQTLMLLAIALMILYFIVFR